MASTPLRVATPKSPMSARGSPSSSSPSQRSRTTLGPFSPGVSKSRSLAAIEKTMREMNLYASRSMPHGNEADDRSVLTGVRVMMRAARLMEANAAANMNRIKEQKRGNDGDPRAAMREQLNRARREAADAARQLEGHEHALQDHCDKLQDEYGRLVEIQEAFSGAVESSSFASTPSAGAASRSPGKSPGSGGGGFSRPSSALSSPGTPSRAPWTASEDAALLEQVRRSGFSWAVVAGAIPARTASLCKDRWEQLVDEACRRARERQHAMSKASNDAEACLRAVGSTITLSRSKVQEATKHLAGQQHALAEQRAKQRNWEQFATLTGASDEHTRVRKLLVAIGPARLLKRLLDGEAGGPRALEEELRLQRLVFEVGRLPVDAAASEAAPPGGAGAAPRASAGRAFMRVRDAVTSEVCLEWAEPASTRSTDPSKAKPQGKLSRRLYEGEGGEGGEETGGVRRR